MGTSPELRRKLGEFPNPVRCADNMGGFINVCKLFVTMVTQQSRLGIFEGVVQPGVALPREWVPIGDYLAADLDFDNHSSLRDAKPSFRLASPFEAPRSCVA